MKPIILETIDSIARISATQSLFYAENCISSLERHNHKAGCVMNVTGDSTQSFEIHWSTEINGNGYQEVKKVTEHSAEAISFFLGTYLTDYEVCLEATIGTGFDYWLCYKTTHEKYNPRNFLQARLEISGIDSETSLNSVAGRVKKKKAQTDASDSLRLPAYISIVELSTPKAHFSKK